MYVLFDGWEGNMAGYRTSVRPFFYELQASENTAQCYQIRTIKYGKILVMYI